MFIDTISAQEMVAFANVLDGTIEIVPKTSDVAQNRDDSIDMFEAMNMVLGGGYHLKIDSSLICNVNID